MLTFRAPYGWCPGTRARVPTGALSVTRIHWIAAMAGCGPAQSLALAPSIGPVHVVIATVLSVSATSAPVTALQGGPPLTTCTMTVVPSALTRVHGVAVCRCPATGSAGVGVGIGSWPESGRGDGPGIPEAGGAAVTALGPPTGAVVGPEPGVDPCPHAVAAPSRRAAIASRATATSARGVGMRARLRQHAGADERR